MNQPKRICIYPKDIMRITGKTERYGRKLLDRIRTKNLKTEDQFITIEEFCDYSGLKIEQVLPLIID